MTPAEQWLRERASDAPPALMETMLGALSPADRPIAEALAEAALGTLARVLTTSGGRDIALPLLAADALLTHAFQTLAEEEPDSIGAFAEWWGGGGRLGILAESLAGR